MFIYDPFSGIFDIAAYAISINTYSGGIDVLPYLTGHPCYNELFFPNPNY
jgi:hypothetical protein